MNAKKALFALFVGLFLAPKLPALETGKPAPDFKLKDQNGSPVSLSQYKGKTVVLEWVNSGCPFVGKHYGSGHMQGLQRKHIANGVVWLSISSSAKGKEGYWATGEDAFAWRQAQHASMTAILLDPSGKVGKLFGAKTTPHMFIIDKSGKLVYQGAIDDKPSTDPKDLSTAKNWVDQALGEIAAGKPVSVSDTKAYGCSVKYAK
jgi:hypothetical protein